MLPMLGKDEWHPLLSFRSALDRLFDDFLGDRFPMRRSDDGPRYLPAVDVHETDDALIVETELPGMNPKDVSVEVTSDTLTIRGERKREAEQKSKTYHRQELCWGKFERQIALPAPVDSAKADATFANGLLKIVLPKQAGAKTRAVAVRVK